MSTTADSQAIAAANEIANSPESDTRGSWSINEIAAIISKHLPASSDFVRGYELARHDAAKLAYDLRAAFIVDVAEKIADRIRAIVPPAQPEILTPAVGDKLLCLVCAYEKPWGIFNNKTGASVCVGCRNRASSASQLLYEALKASVHALRSYQYGNCETQLAQEVADAAGAALSVYEKNQNSG